MDALVTTDNPTVFLIEDDEYQNRYLAAIIQSADWPVQTFGSAQSFLDSYNPTQPGCLVLDLLLPDANGLEVQQDLREQGATLPIIFISTHCELGVVKQAFKNGALDYFQKPVNPVEFLKGIKDAITLDAAQRQIRLAQQAIETRLRRLTARERTVLDHLLAGLSNKDIADTLHISIRTVETHRHHILKKMHVNQLHELIRVMANNRLIGERTDWQLRNTT